MNNEHTRSHGLCSLHLLCLLAIVAILPGCATVTGLTTGAFTGFVDLPNELIRINDFESDEGGTWLLAIVSAPVGFAVGPFYGFVKGVALDVSTLTGAVSLTDQFDSYGRSSIWRPYSRGWADDARTDPPEMTQRLEEMGDGPGQ